MSADEDKNSEAAENTSSFQEFIEKSFDEEQISDATQKRNLVLQSEKIKKSQKFHPWREAFVNTKLN